MQGTPSIDGGGAAVDAAVGDVDPDDDVPEDPEGVAADGVDFATSPSVPSTTVTFDTPVTASRVAPGTYFATTAADVAREAGYWTVVAERKATDDGVVVLNPAFDRVAELAAAACETPLPFSTLTVIADGESAGAAGTAGEVVDEASSDATNEAILAVSTCTIET